MGECNTILSAYTMYRHLEKYSTLPSIYSALYQTWNYQNCPNTMHLQMIFLIQLSGKVAIFFGRDRQNMLFNPLPHNATF